FALENHTVAATMRTGIADETMVHTIYGSMTKTIGRSSHHTNRTACEGAGYEVVRTIFVTEVATNHLGCADSTFATILARCCRDIPRCGNYHADESAGQVPCFINDSSGLGSLGISEARCCHSDEKTERKKHRHYCLFSHSFHHLPRNLDSISL